MYFLKKGVSLSIEMVNKYIDNYKIIYLPKLIKNKRYYDVKNDTIMNRAFQDPTKPNNKYATSWSKYITTLISGYFMGKPVTYATGQEDLQKFISDNNAKEISHNQSIEKDCSIYGLAAELLYVDVNKNVKYEKINPCGVIPIYSTSITKEILYCIRYWENEDILTGEKITYVEVYDNKKITYYTETGGIFRESKIENHAFNDVPINIFYNNEEMTGDAEGVQSQIDGYDLALSDTANYRQELNDSYLVFKNTNLETDDIVTMKEKRIIQIEDADQGMQSGVEWLNKDSNDVENENYKTRLADDIKRFSFVADIEAAKSHTTATSAKIGLVGIEQICVDKESCFRMALMRRLQLVCNVKNISGAALNLDDVSITFVRNIPIDLSVIADTIAKLAPFVPKAILLEQVPFINDVQKALQMKVEEEKMNSYEDIFKDGEVGEE
ncbi:MAG: phage portal protein [Cellulosilyticaceae bacterium]